MEKSRFSEAQIIAVLKEHEAGVKTADLCRKHGISSATLYAWKSKFGGLDVSDIAKLGRSRMRIAGSSASWPIRRSTSTRSSSSPPETTEARTATSRSAGDPSGSRHQRTRSVPVSWRKTPYGALLQDRSQRRTALRAASRHCRRASTLRHPSAGDHAATRGSCRGDDAALGRVPSSEPASPQTSEAATATFHFAAVGLR